MKLNVSKESKDWPIKVKFYVVSDESDAAKLFPDETSKCGDVHWTSVRPKANVRNGSGADFGIRSVSASCLA